MELSIKLQPEKISHEAHAERVNLVVDGQRRETKEGEGGKPLRYLKLVKIQKKVNTCILKN